MRHDLRFHSNNRYLIQKSQTHFLATIRDEKFKRPGLYENKLVPADTTSIHNTFCTIGTRLH